MIDDKTLDYLFSLSRIEGEKDEKKRQKLKEDLSKILDHFKELQEIDTSSVEPLIGGNFFSFQGREDESQAHPDIEKERERKNIIEQFPHEERGYVKVPPVFE